MDLIQGTDPQLDLARTFADAARALQESASFNETLQRIVDLAVATVPGCDHASLSLQANGHGSAPVGTGRAAVRLDELQQEAGEGPCRLALAGERLVHVENLAADGRWPLFSKAAVELGFGSMLSCRLFVPRTDETLGALNLYSSTPLAFDVPARDVALMFTDHAGLALAGAEQELRAALREHNLEEALRSRDVIGQAKGILMAREHITAEEAFERLRRASQHENRKLRVIADELVSSNGSSSNGSSSNGSSSNGSASNGSGANGSAADKA
jgi:ANTAR domain-containing protein/GAF domain-containing protein